MLQSHQLDTICFPTWNRDILYTSTSINHGICCESPPWSPEDIKPHDFWIQVRVPLRARAAGSVTFWSSAQVDETSEAFPRVLRHEESSCKEVGPRVVETRWSPRTRMPTRMLRNRDLILDLFVTISCEPTCGTPWLDTLRWHSCRTPLLDTIALHSDKTLLLDTLIWHSCGTLLLDTLLRHSYLTLL